MKKRIFSITGIIFFLIIVTIFYLCGEKIRIFLLPKVKITYPDYAIINNEYCYMLPSEYLKTDFNENYIIIAEQNKKYGSKIYNVKRVDVNYENAGDFIIVKHGINSETAVIIDDVKYGMLCVLSNEDKAQ